MVLVSQAVEDQKLLYLGKLKVGDFAKSKRINRSEIRRILVRVPNWVGDAVMAFPALEALRENFPGSTIAILTKPPLMPLYEDHPSVEEVIPFKKTMGYPGALLSVLSVAVGLRRYKFDLAVLFQNAFEAALLAWLAGIPNRLGYNRDGRGVLLSHAVPVKKGGSLHQVEYYLGILHAMNWRAESRDPRLHIHDEYIGSSRSLLRSCGIEESDFLLGIGPGAAYGPSKRWSSTGFAAVADMAAERWGAKVAVLGSENERSIAEAVILAMKFPAVNLCGKTNLAEAAAVIGRCGAFVTNDSGLMHMAAAMDVPMVAVFGSTDPIATGPRSRKARVVRHPISCSPCLRIDCSDGYRCLDSIQPHEVWRELEGLRKEPN